jgi:hypothetical protein
MQEIGDSRIYHIIERLQMEGNHIILQIFFIIV